MSDGKIWSAEELLAMTPDQRYAVVNAGIITDLDQVPPHLLEQAKADIRSHIDESDHIDDVQ